MMPTRNTPARRFRTAAAALALTLCLSLQSCFTAVLWTSEMEEETMLSLTPLSLTLDALTLPIQAAVLCGGARVTCR